MVRGRKAGWKFGAIFMGAGLILSSQASAQQVQVAAAPDAGQLLRQTTPEQAIPAPSKPDIDGLPGVKAPRAEGATVKVTAWHITGNALFSSDVLEALLADDLGKELSLGGLDQAAAKITQYYRSAGYPLAQAYLPRQKVGGGVIEIVVLEGRVEKVSADEASQDKLNPGLLQDYLATVPTGELAQEDSLNRLAEVLNELPGMSAKLTLQPGQRPGGTEVLLTLDQTETWKAGGGLDNYGSYGTGRTEMTAFGSYYNLAGRGDSLDLRAMRTDGDQTSGTVNYGLAVSGAGDRLGFSASKLNYSLGGIYTDQGHGTAQTFGTNYRMPLRRTPTSNITGLVMAEYKKLRDVNTANDSQRHDEAVTAGVSAAMSDPWGGTLAYANLTGGRIGFDNGETKISDQAATGPHTEGNFAKLAYSLSRIQPIDSGFSLFGGLTGQNSGGKRLDSAERMSLGGANSVRAFPTGETTGDSGYVATGELRYTPTFWGDLPGKAQVALFYDAGRITKNSTNDTATDTSGKSGYGIGFGYDLGPVQARTSLAWRTSGIAASDPHAGPHQLYFQLLASF